VSNGIIAGILYKNGKKIIKSSYGIWLRYATRGCGAGSKLNSVDNVPSPAEVCALNSV
jgi:hypothetical protein